jgi:hypothetical protein
MNSILETPETKPSNAGGGLGNTLGKVATGLAVVALGAATYLFVELRDAHRQIARLTEQATSAEKKTKELDLGLAAVRGQTATIAERSGVTEAELKRRRRPGASRCSAGPGGRPLGGEVGQVKEDVAATKAAIEETQAKLQSAIGDLGQQSGLIARNAEELDALKRTGLREYYEFDLAKGKAPSPVGPVAVRLKDADAKRHKFNMVLVVDDLEIEKKDKTLLGRAVYRGLRQLNEIVIYAVQKDRITGYLSTPKAGDAAASAK